MGGLCSDLGAKSVEDEKSCQAVSDMVEKIEVKTFFLKYDLHWYFPKGCYTTPLDGGIHFNPSPDGDRQPMARQICTPGNQTQSCILPLLLSFTYTITKVRFHLSLPNKVQQLVITKITKISNVEIPGILIACL